MEFIKQGEYPRGFGGYIIYRDGDIYIVKEWEDEDRPIKIGFCGRYRDCVEYVIKQIQFLRCLYEDF